MCKFKRFTVCTIMQYDWLKSKKNSTLWGALFLVGYLRHSVYKDILFLPLVKNPESNSVLTLALHQTLVLDQNLTETWPYPVNKPQSDLYSDMWVGVMSIGADIGVQVNFF